MQKQYISNLLERNPSAVIIGSLGTISYDLAEISHKNKIIIKGAMGCALGCGLGYALSSKKKVFVLIGDGAFLMKMGSISSILRYKPRNLKVIIFNNNSYASCGGQKTNFRYLRNNPTMVKVINL